MSEPLETEFFYSADEIRLLSTEYRKRGWALDLGKFSKLILFPEDHYRQQRASYKTQCLSSFANANIL